VRFQEAAPLVFACACSSVRFQESVPLVCACSSVRFQEAAPLVFACAYTLAQSARAPRPACVLHARASPAQRAAVQRRPRPTRAPAAEACAVHTHDGHARAVRSSSARGVRMLPHCPDTGAHSGGYTRRPGTRAITLVRALQYEGLLQLARCTAAARADGGIRLSGSPRRVRACMTTCATHCSSTRGRWHTVPRQSQTSTSVYDHLRDAQQQHERTVGRGSAAVPDEYGRV